MNASPPRRNKKLTRSNFSATNQSKILSDDDESVESDSDYGAAEQSYNYGASKQKSLGKKKSKELNNSDYLLIKPDRGTASSIGGNIALRARQSLNNSNVVN